MVFTEIMLQKVLTVNAPVSEYLYTVTIAIKLGGNRPQTSPTPTSLGVIPLLKVVDTLSVKTFGNESLVFLVYSLADPIILPNPIVWVGAEGF